jgi:DNA polymerase
MIMLIPRKLHIDIETYSSVDLKRCGVHKYAASPDFEILLVTFGYCDIKGRRVFEQYEPANGIPVPKDRLSWLENADVVKYAFNAMFERVCFGAVLGRTLDPAEWRCVMVKCGFAGLPMKLDKVSKVLDLDNVKLAGAHLINYFSKPCKPSKANGGRSRNLPAHSPEKWKEYKTYNLADVAAEWDVDEYIDGGGVTVPKAEWGYYALDQRINDRGVYVDIAMAKNGAEMASEIKGRLYERIRRITGVENPRSVSQLRGWLAGYDCDTPDLQADTLKGLLKVLPGGPAREVVALREQASRTSTDKYAAVMHCVDHDQRARGLFAFNGASRTGRYASRRVQLHNLSRIYFAGGDDSGKILDLARSVVCRGDVSLFELMYENPVEILSQLVRTVFTGAPGKVIVAADYSAIEARVLAWLASENWKLEVFRTHGKIYEATAARMFDIPFESVTKGSDLRQKGKVAELAFGYGGAVGAVDRMGFLDSGTLKESEVLRMVNRWRKENRNIVKTWRNYEYAAHSAVRYRGEHFEAGRCDFVSNSEWLFIRLPSGRELAYYHPVIKPNKKGGSSLWYEGEDDRKQWTLIPTYGGKLAENITQAVSRDLLCDAQYRLDRAGYTVVLHVHDEIGNEVDADKAGAALKAVCDSMTVTPAWAKGLPLRADGFTSKYYKK